MIQNFGSDTQKKIFLEKMINGTWGGTMDLTEPGAGSDVGALTTTAEKNPDGTYTITGNKIFITGGEQDLTENIIHPVLARIKGAPEGAKGISLFIVPKYWVNEDGSLGEFNDIVCTGIEKKMGISGSATCSLTFGGQGKCRGLLLGEEHKGMRVMFQMMNEARILVGSIGAISASAAYLYAVNYARDRYQGRDLEKIFETDAPQVPIIHHPDVRRMLLKMKAYVEGMRSLQYFGYYCIEKEKIGKDDKEKSYYKGLLDLLTPIMKSYCTDRGFEVCSEALQVFGGYGYTREYPVEQLLRDVRIASIYEGTNGIQAMDLLARKLPMKEGAIFLNLMGEIEKTINMARSFTVLTGLADRLKKAVDKLGLLTGHMGKTAMSADLKVAFAHASPYLETIGDVIMGWMLLWRATVAEPKLQEILEKQPGKERETIIQKNKNAAFYQGQLNSADYFIKSVLPITLGKMEAIMENCSAVVDIPEESFGG
jgi:alkylation response protein AidB-like acyl-CoA dehydrogenase